MTLTPATIKSAEGAKKNSKRLGRGNGSGKGTYSGRGGKGQTARSGGKKRTQIRAFKSQLQKVPKLRGFKSHHRKEEIVTLKVLDSLFKDGDKVTPEILQEKGLVSVLDKGVKILATGELNKKLTIENCVTSKRAMELIEKAGGKLVY